MPFDTALSIATHVLSEAQAGARVRVTGFVAGQGLERRMTELGLARGAEVEIVGRMGRKGAVIVAAHGTRLVIGGGMADRIEVAVLA